jgi:transaldolase
VPPREYELAARLLLQVVESDPSGRSRAALSRTRLTTNPADLVAHDHVVGVTTNPTIFAKAITGGDAYAGQIRDLWTRGAAVGEALRAMTAFDVRWACDVLRPLYDATDGVDGRVSI